MDSLERFSEEKWPEQCLYSSVRDETNGDDSKKLDSHISDKDYLT